MKSNTNESTSGSFWAPSPSHAPSSSSSYALNGKIMFISTIVIFVAVTFVFCFRIHARLFFHHRNRRRRIRENLSSLADADPVVSSSSSRPLDPSVLVKIPAFVYSSKGAGADAVTTPFDCAVCLSEFENEEEGRVLPICNHVFHVECIDTWFKSRSTCPLCRFPVLVQPPKPENPLEPSGSACPSSNTDKVSEQYRIGSSQVRFPPESSRRQPIELLTVLVDVSPGVGLSGDTGSKQPSQRGSSLKGIWSI